MPSSKEVRVSIQTGAKQAPVSEPTETKKGHVWDAGELVEKHEGWQHDGLTEDEYAALPKEGE